MTQTTRAVFLSYASQDAEAARRISDGLRAAGIEVWIDQGDLRSGDAWDQTIRKQIHDCALFIPIISANTQARLEGYFRREWNLAVERMHAMAEQRPFLVPVVIDATNDQDAHVPERFRAVHWTRLLGGDTPASFGHRVTALLVGTEKPGPVPASATPRSTDSQQRVLARWLAVGGVGILVAAAITWQTWRLTTRERAAVPAATPGVAAMPTAMTAKSIAVLPFLDMSEKHDQEYFSDGLSEELLDLLAKTEGLEVIARTSSFYFKGKQVTIAEIANTLHVAHLLEGSVRKAGNTMRVTAQLIRANDGVHLWSDTYDRDFKDVFKVQDEIAAAVVKALQIKLLPTAIKAQSAPSNTDAYSLYLRGQYFARRASDVDVERGIVNLKQAIALEPGFAPAHAELASAYVYAGTFGLGEEGTLVLARAEADEALRLDPTLRSARNVRTNLAMLSWQWARARAQLDEAVASGPRDPDALFRRGQLARALGHSEEALAYYHQAMQLDPLGVISHIQLAMLLDGLRRPDDARAAAEAALAINPTATKAYLLIGLLELNAGHLDAASDAFEHETGEYYRLEGQAILAFAKKHMAESDAALGRLIAAYPTTAGVQIAQAYAYRGERAKAIDWLDRAAEHYDPGLINVKTDPLFASLHGDARYRALLRRMNLPE